MNRINMRLLACILALVEIILTSTTLATATGLTEVANESVNLGGTTSEISTKDAAKCNFKAWVLWYCDGAYDSQTEECTGTCLYWGYYDDPHITIDLNLYAYFPCIRTIPGSAVNFTVCNAPVPYDGPIQCTLSSDIPEDKKHIFPNGYVMYETPGTMDIMIHKCEENSVPGHPTSRRTS